VLVVCKPSHHFIHPDKDHPVLLKRILCAVDFEPNNQRIKDLALSLARVYQSEIFFLNVTSGASQEDYDRQKETAAKLLKELVSAEDEDWCRINFVVEKGEPGEVITRLIEKQNIDLVIMGHHTRRPIEELFLGSVTKRVVPDSACPVLVVRSEADLVYS
jgi:nucleotide-binding universal stress UspA family protein